jgi:hypothetical protein
MVPRSFVDSDRKFGGRNLVAALLRFSGGEREKRLERIRGSLTPKREQASPERGTGKSHRRAIAAKGDSHDFQI